MGRVKPMAKTDQLRLRKEDSVTAEVNYLKRILDKIFLISLKFICHIEGLIYVIYSIFSLFDIDLINIGYIADVSLLTWLFIYLASWRFKFCYVHRLPLYYIFINELITSIDYLIGIPVCDKILITFHIILIGILIFGYSYYYNKMRYISYLRREDYIKPDNLLENILEEFTLRIGLTDADEIAEYIILYSQRPPEDIIEDWISIDYVDEDTELSALELLNMSLLSDGDITGESITSSGYYYYASSDDILYLYDSQTGIVVIYLDTND